MQAAVVLVCGCHPAPKRYDCFRTAAPPVIDGRLDEASWKRAAWTDAFVDIEGDSRPLPRFETRAKMMWDDEYFYVGARLDDPHVWGSLTEHDAIVFQDNDFEVFIDPDGDSREYCEIEVNALNTIFDLLLVRTYRDGGPARHEWDVDGLKTAVHVDGTLSQSADVDSGWSVEMAIPWTSLAPYADGRAPPRAEDLWRVNFSRVQWQHQIVDGRYVKRPDAREDNWVWTPQGAVNMHLPHRWGFVAFINADSDSNGRSGSSADRSALP